MSYISLPRIAFSGRFQADVSTVNNDVRHYDNTTFESRFQQPQSRTAMNGWWNPDGTGAFRLIDVVVQQAVATPGDSGAADPATGLFLNAQIERTAAKLVDLDPQFQMGSAIWGLRVSLTDGTTEYMRGDFLAAPFRDLFFGRAPQGGSGGATAKYTSVLENVEFSSAVHASPVLSALMVAAQANGDHLSVNLMTFGYITNSCSDEFSYGNVTGSIGVWETGSPLKFVRGRRFSPILSSSPFANRSNIGFFDGDVDADIVSLDLSNALPLSATDGSLTDLGELRLALLKNADTMSASGKITPIAVEDTSIPESELIDIGAIPYQDADWLTSAAGIADFPIPAAAKALIGERPLAVVTPDGAGTNSAKIRVRESYAGLFLRADTMEFRVDAATSGPVVERTTLYVSQYGKPAANQPVTLALNRPESDVGGGGSGPSAPKAKIPDTGTPQDKVRFASARTSDAAGRLDLDIAFEDPENPRIYIDGQIYKINYAFNYQGISAIPYFEQIVAHVRDAFELTTKPGWASDIEPILRQYGNLYPIMSHGLFSFSDEDVVRQHARILAFALTRPLSDPNHMPATRDMSEGKRRAILEWLSDFLDETERPAALAGTMAPPDPGLAVDDVPRDQPQIAPHATRTETIPDALKEGTDGKTQAARDLLNARRKVK